MTSCAPSIFAIPVPGTLSAQQVEQALRQAEQRGDLPAAVYHPGTARTGFPGRVIITGDIGDFARSRGLDAPSAPLANGTNGVAGGRPTDAVTTADIFAHGPTFQEIISRMVDVADIMPSYRADALPGTSCPPPPEAAYPETAQYITETVLRTVLEAEPRTEAEQGTPNVERSVARKKTLMVWGKRLGTAAGIVALAAIGARLGRA